MNDVDLVHASLPPTPLIRVCAQLSLAPGQFVPLYNAPASEYIELEDRSNSGNLFYSVSGIHFEQEGDRGQTDRPG